MVTKLRLFLIGNKRDLTSTSVELEELSAQTKNYEIFDLALAIR